MRLALFDELAAPAEEDPGSSAYVQIWLEEAQDDPDNFADE